MARYNPGSRSRDMNKGYSHPSEIAGHRPALTTRIYCEDPTNPLDTLRGQDYEPGEFYSEESEDQSYHREEIENWFNRGLRGGHRAQSPFGRRR